MTTPTQYSLLMAFHIVCRATFAFTDTYWSHLESPLNGLDSPPKRQWMQQSIIRYCCQSVHRSRLFRLRISSSPSRQISNWVKSSAINSPMYAFRAGVFARDELKYWNQKSTAIRKRQQHPNTEGATHTAASCFHVQWVNEFYSLLVDPLCGARKMQYSSIWHTQAINVDNARKSINAIIIVGERRDQTASISWKQKTKRHFLRLSVHRRH